MTAILGGGIAGLSAAFYALENPKIGPLILFEASDRLGGWIKTEKSKSSALFEKGPRTLRIAGLSGKNALQMIDNLDLTNKIIPIPSTHVSARSRLIYADKKLHTLPNSMASLFKFNSLVDRPLFTVMFNDLIAKKGENRDESIYSFVERRFGRDIADYLISPMICGICAGDAKKISVNFLMKTPAEFEQKHRSIGLGLIKEGLQNIFNSKRNAEQEKKEEESSEGSAARATKEKWAIWSLQGGLQQIPEALEKKLTSKNVKIRAKTEVRNVTFKPDCVELEVDGGVQKYERVIASLSAERLGRILERQHPQLARELEAIPAVTVAVINFEFPGKVLPMEAFGFLVPPKEKIPILGVIFDSCVFPQKASTVLTVMMGGAWFDEYFGVNSSQAHMETVALEQLRRILGIKVDPSDSHFQILENCIPQYIVGHEERLKRIRNYITAHKMPLILCGSSYQGVGLNDVILSAKQAVHDIS
ncbi:protoporphyrinogen oxidase [Diachasma alloeum]|uniref:protoporphyrinogen oxidase n=1 Tax=Diachasma alloeum TaxID=454923 RepID=UPI0007384F2A|nr:protoporphyrinogen oxidase [Diachasma alloeum]